MVDVLIEPATLAHAELLAPLLRDADAAEVRASHGLAPREALVQSVKVSVVSYAMLFNSEVAALFGVAPYRWRPDATLAVGLCWALTGRAVSRYPKEFWRQSRPALALLRQACPYLLNMVDARYTASLRWLERLGFTISHEVPFGIEQLPFHLAQIGRP